MGDAARQDAQAFQLLGHLDLRFDFAPLLLGVLALGDVPDEQ